MQTICNKEITLAPKALSRYIRLKMTFLLIEYSQMESIDLKSCGLKKTKSREKIISLLEKSLSPVSAEEIFRKAGGINLSTVYRTLESLYQNGYLNKEVGNDGKAVFSIPKERHRHVLVCTKCHKRIYIDECPYEGANKDVLDKTGFLITNERTEIYGVCQDCRKKKQGI